LSILGVSFSAAEADTPLKLQATNIKLLIIKLRMLADLEKLKPEMKIQCRCLPRQSGWLALSPAGQTRAQHSNSL